MDNRRNEKRPACCQWFGDFSVLGDFLYKKSWCSFWGILKLIHSLFRSFGVISFAGNPFTGILIFLAILLDNPPNAMAAAMTGIAAILTCKLLKTPDMDVCSGVSVFNSVLVGCILTEVLPPVFEFRLTYMYWIVIAIAGFLTTFVDQGLQVMMSPSKLPVQSVPFNIVASIVLLLYRTRFQGFELEENSQKIESSLNETDEIHVDWYLMLEGSVRGAGQIYGIGDTFYSTFVWLAFVLYSPLHAFMCYVGSITGAIIAVMLNVQPLESVYLGLWSFNSLLAAGGITYFVVQTPRGILLAVVNAIFAVSVQAAITPIFMQTAMPVFSFPFNVAIMFTLSMSLREKSSLKFVKKTTFPEEHLLRHYSLCGNEEFEDSDDEADIPLRIFDHGKQ